MKNSQALRTYIKQYDLDKILPESCIEILQIHHFDSNQLIVEEATPVKYLHILVKGKCRITPRSEEGKTAFLDYIVETDVIGDLEYFASNDYFHNVTALLPCVTVSIPVESIDKYFSNNVEFYKYICKNMANKMKRTSLKYSKTLLYPIKNQVANYLYEIYIANKKTVIPLHSKETAEFFGITPRYFRSILVEFEAESILSRELTGIKLKDVDRLRQFTKYK